MAEAHAEVLVMESTGLFNNDGDLEKAWEMMIKTCNEEVIVKMA